MLTSEVAVVKFHHGISVKCSRYWDTRPTDPSLVISIDLLSVHTNMLHLPYHWSLLLELWKQLVGNHGLNLFTNLNLTFDSCFNFKQSGHTIKVLYFSYYWSNLKQLTWSYELQILWQCQIWSVMSPSRFMSPYLVAVIPHLDKFSVYCTKLVQSWDKLHQSTMFS